MRKVEVTFKSDTRLFDINGGLFTAGEVETIFGELPGKGEARSYWIVPAGDVAEFWLARDESEMQDSTLSSREPVRDDVGCVEGFECQMDADDAFNLFGVTMEPGETRRVTAIVHPPDEPKEETVEAIPAKQPIILKRNNTPTRPGNYLGAECKNDDPEVCEVSVAGDSGDLRFYDSEGDYTGVHFFDYWSDELGPIEFEAEPEPPPKDGPKVGWFDFDDRFIRVMQTDNGHVVLDRTLNGELMWRVDKLKDHYGIEITWYGDDA